MAMTCLIDTLEHYARLNSNVIKKVRPDLEPEDVYYAVHASPDGRCGTIVYFTESARRYITARYRDLSRALKYVSYGFLYIIASFVQDTNIRVLDTCDKKLLFAIYLRDCVRRLVQARKDPMFLIFEDKNLAVIMLYTTIIGKSFIVGLFLDDSREFHRAHGYELTELDCSAYWDIAYTISNVLKSELRQEVAEAWLFGRECGLDIDIAVRFNTGRDRAWRCLMPLLAKRLVEKYGCGTGMYHILVSRLDMFVYCQEEEDNFLRTARQTGISLV